ncbi:hypothetical protein T484DRAFT_1809680 [Baffinella frigidus]|nr:hypothetical protein T484DRAFT_1809680 [Cryptophyta sp. CCMP2293]
MATLPRLLALLALAGHAAAFSSFGGVRLSRASRSSITPHAARFAGLRAAPLQQQRGAVLGLMAAADVKPSAEALGRAQKALPDSKFMEYNTENIAQVLEKVWLNVAELIEKKGESRLLYFPQSTILGNSAVVNRLVGHLQICQDCCDDFGNFVTLTVVPTSGEVETMPLFLLKNLQAADSSDDDEDSWDEDDDWGDDADILAKYANLLGDEGGKDAKAQALYNQLSNVPAGDPEVTSIIRDWVRVIVSDMGVCPFSKNPDQAGLPAGPVHYPISRQTRVEDMYWKEVNFLVSSDPKEFSTTLHILPNFCISNVEAFTSWTDTLTAPLEALGIEKYIQLVFFHPQWVFRDGEPSLLPTCRGSTLHKQS